MLKYKKLSPVDRVLLLVLVVMVVAVFSVFRWRASTEGERIKLETRVQTTEQNAIAADKEANLESLTQALEQAQLALGDSPFPTEEKARAFVDEIAKFSQMNNVVIVTWNQRYSSVASKMSKYPVMTHSLTLEGKPDSLTNFVNAVTHAPASPLVQNMNMSVVTAKEDVWRMELELVVYYHD